MSLTSQIRARIKTDLEAIDGIGVVHDYERWTSDWKRFLELMKDPDSQTIRGWTITRESSEGQREAPAEANRSPLYVIRGYWGLSDLNASEKAFDDLIEAVQNALGADVTMGSIVDHVEEPIVRMIEPRMYGSVLCHYVEIAIRVHTTQAYTLV